MNQSQLAQANIENLTNLWKIMGATTQDINGTIVHHSTSWPYRLWLPFAEKFNPANINDLLADLSPISQPSIFPVWKTPSPELTQVLAKHQFHSNFEQRCMVLDLSTVSLTQSSTGLVFKTISTNEDADCWTHIASESFGYVIDPAVTRHILGHPDITLILAYHDNIPIGSALIYTSENIAGIHTIGVIPDYRRKGYARHIMNHVLDIAVQSQAHYATLQASPMGESLYQQLGFQAQFTMTSFMNLSI